MDSLILTFNKDQMQLYKELLTKENIELNFDAKLTPIQEYSFDVLDIAILSIKIEILKLTKFKKQKMIFSSSLSEEKIEELIPIYYEVIRNINCSRKNLRNEMITLSCLIKDIDKLIANIKKRYANFLPYKAALYNKDKYSTEIFKIDKEFKANIEKAEIYKKFVLSYFDQIINLSDIISDFFEKSSKASDEPKFKSFNSTDFFWTVEAFIERIKTVKNN